MLKQDKDTNLSYGKIYINDQKQTFNDENKIAVLNINEYIQHPITKKL